MRVCVKKGSNELIEMQSGATAGTLIKNATNNGYSAMEVKEIEITEQEWETIYKPKLVDVDAIKVKQLIKDKQKELAIKELKKEGKLDQNCNLLKENVQ